VSQPPAPTTSICSPRKKLGIPVRNVPDYGSDSVAEHVIATLFALRRELPTYLIAARDGRWGQSPHFCWTGPRIRDLGASLFGVVGRGRIGESVARLARGLGMRVVFAQTPGRDCADDELPLNELLSLADTVSLHVPLTPQTNGLISRRTLALMKARCRPHQHGTRRAGRSAGAGRGAACRASRRRRHRRAGKPSRAPVDHALLAPDIPPPLADPHVAMGQRQLRKRRLGRPSGRAGRSASG
jgi:glycerate dehydrogenase